MDEMHYHPSHQEDAYIHSRLTDALLWSCQYHSTFDGEFRYGRKGWMSERSCHSEGLLTEHDPNCTLASTWFALMPWACGSILEGLTERGGKPAFDNTNIQKASGTCRRPQGVEKVL